MLTKPVLFITFNRLEKTKLSFERIRQAKPPRLYLASDGGRNKHEQAIVQNIRDYLSSNIDWECEVKTKFNPKNLGMRNAVASAISWFFENEEDGIILEDDCVADSSFFPYCQELLNRYRKEKRIWAVCGENPLNVFTEDNSTVTALYHFIKRFNCWGWASWADRWKYYNKFDPAHYNLSALQNVNNRAVRCFWQYMVARYRYNTLNSWAYQWSLVILEQQGLCIQPAVNLVTNIGINGTSCGRKWRQPMEDRDHALNHPAQTIAKELIHPEKIEANERICRLIDDSIHPCDRIEAKMLWECIRQNPFTFPFKRHFIALLCRFGLLVLDKMHRKTKMLATSFIFDFLTMLKCFHLMMSGIFELFRHFKFSRTSFRCYQSTPVRNNSILIVEYFPFHGELFPGIIKYFCDLNYNVDIFCRRRHINEKAFADCKSAAVRIYPLPILAIKYFLKTPAKLNKYDFVFFNTFDEQHSLRLNIVNSCLDYLGVSPKPKYGVLGLIHHIDKLPAGLSQSFIKEKRLFALRESRQLNCVPMLNTHYFRHSPSIGIKTCPKFLISGRIINSVRDYPLFLKAIEKLLRENYHNFKIYICGSNSLYIPKEFGEFIRFFGRLDNESFYDLVEKSDYLLPLLNSDSKHHLHYLNSTTSGTVQLSLGFLKPMLIEKPFAEGYGFDDSTAILYNADNLCDAFKTALNIIPQEYVSMQMALKKMSEKIQEKSLNNLVTTITTIKCC